eukprot:scaffold21555_cov66-Phaeocystis_antarctica.AAC.6
MTGHETQMNRQPHIGTSRREAPSSLSTRSLSRASVRPVTRLTTLEARGARAATTAAPAIAAPTTAAPATAAPFAASEDGDGDGDVGVGRGEINDHALVAFPIAARQPTADLVREGETPGPAVCGQLADCLEALRKPLLALRREVRDTWRELDAAVLAGPAHLILREHVDHQRRAAWASARVDGARPRPILLDRELVHGRHAAALGIGARPRELVGDALRKTSPVTADAVGLLRDGVDSCEQAVVENAAGKRDAADRPLRLGCRSRRWSGHRGWSGHNIVVVGEVDHRPRSLGGGLCGEVLLHRISTLKRTHDLEPTAGFPPAAPPTAKFASASTARGGEKTGDRSRTKADLGQATLRSCRTSRCRPWRRRPSLLPHFTVADPDLG